MSERNEFQLGTLHKLSALPAQQAKHTQFSYQQVQDSTLRIGPEQFGAHHRIDFEKMPKGRFRVTTSSLDDHISTEALPNSLKIRFKQNLTEITITNPGNETEIVIDDGLFKIRCRYQHDQWSTSLEKF